MPLSARASILAADVVPEEGGQTEWADMRALLKPWTTRLVKK